MSEENQQDTTAGDAELKDAQTSALVAASTVIIFSAIYWFLQIQSVRDLLELAYG
jgi:hypothetical protein